MKRKYVLFYTVNGLGLGHLTRSLAIARQLKKQDNSFVPLFFTASEGSHLLYQEDFAYYKVPSKNIARESKLLKRNLALSYAEILSSVVNTYRPVGLVVDTFPLGSMNDLFSVLGLPLKWKKFFIHREQMQMDQSRIATQNFYDWIIAPHTQGSAKIPVPNTEKLFWSNEIIIREKFELQTRNQIREDLEISPEETLVLLNLGGGGDKTILKNYQQIVEIIEKNLNKLPTKLRFLIPQAPLSSKIFQKELSNLLPKNVLSISHFPLIELMPSLDFAISAAGYNTFHELLICQVPTIFIPKTRGYDDQSARAKKAEKYGAALCLEEEKIQSELIQKLEFLMTQKDSFIQKSKFFVQTDGAERAAKFLIEKLSE